MGYTDHMTPETKQRIIQELVPGKQITLAHVIAGPVPEMYTKLGLDPTVDYGNAAIGIQLGFVDRFSGTLIITGTVSEVEAAIHAVLDYVEGELGYSCVPLTKT